MSVITLRERGPGEINFADASAFESAALPGVGTACASSDSVLADAQGVTLFLNEIGKNPCAADELIGEVYDELRRLAATRLAREVPGQTLQPTALVHEAYLRLLGGAGEREWNSRGHFFGAAAEAMRRILVEKARQKMSQKRGAGADRVDFSDIELAIETDDEQLLLVNEALDKLAAHDQEAAQLVKLRFFAGLTGGQAAEALGLSQRSATRLWAYARAWLFQELRAS